MTNFSNPNPVDGDRRPDLFDLHRELHFNVDALAHMAKVARPTVIAMLKHQPVLQSDAEKVLAKLSSLFDADYSLETVRVVLSEASHAESK